MKIRKWVYRKLIIQLLLSIVLSFFMRTLLMEKLLHACSETERRKS